MTVSVFPLPTQSMDDVASQLRLLIVEDDKLTRVMYSDYLSSKYDIVTAEDGFTAVSMVLSRMAGGRQRSLRLLFAGSIVGLWGCPQSVSPRSDSLEELPFRLGGTPAPTSILTNPTALTGDQLGRIN